MAVRTHYRACNVCEALCGLAIEVEAGVVGRIRGDTQDPFSGGHICPKALALKDLQDDPDRLRTPVRRHGDRWEPLSWAAAFEHAGERLQGIIQAHGGDAVGFYLGNPNVHNHGSMTHPRRLLEQVGTRNIFSATSVDQLAHHVACHYLYGHQMLVPIPDIDRTAFFLVIGANPMVSNGSMMTAPGMRGRLRALRERGGQLHVVDPRRTETAALAQAHYPVRPGSDVWLLLALLNVVFADGLARPSRPERLAGADAVAGLVAAWTPERVAARTGIEATRIRALAQAFAAAPQAVAYGRLGVSTQRFGGLCQWLIQLLNIFTGNLDRVGGALVTDPAVDLVRQRLMGRGSPGRTRSAVRDLPGFSGELPAAALHDEIAGDHPERIRALVTIAGNPVSSTPGGGALDAVLGRLDFMLAVDFYINETTRHADLILPPTTPLERDHYDYAFLSLAVRNVSRYNPAVLAPPADALHDWEICQGLADALARRAGRPTRKPRSPRRLLAIALANGPRGRRRGHPDALDLARLEAAPHGLDLGPLQPGLLDRLQTPDGRVCCVPPVFLEDLQRANAAFDAADPGPGELLLIGRREPRSNNSWLHNYPRFVRGDDHCRLLVHPDDAAARGLVDDAPVRLQSAHGEIAVRVRIDAAVRPGVVCLPHGWGQGRPGVQLGTAAPLAGASFNDLTGGSDIDTLTGAAVLSGITVRLQPV